MRPIVYFLASVIITVISQSALAQNMVNMRILSAAEPRPVLLNEVSMRAVRDFERTYKSADNIKWFRAAEGFVVYCNQGGASIKVFYSDKGHYKCTVRNYDESGLPANVRHLVRSNYYDLTIFYVTEISTVNDKAYFIKLEGKTSWSEVKVMDGELIHVNEYSKG